MEYCSKCGAEIPEGSRFCPKCGQPVEYPEREYGVQEPVRSTSRPTPSTGTAESASGAIAIGAIGLVFACLIPLVGCILGIAAIAMGSSASNRGVPSAGTAVALGAVALVIAMLFWLLALLVVVPFLF